MFLAMVKMVGMAEMLCEGSMRNFKFLIVFFLSRES